METKKTEIKKLNKGGFVLLDDVPCKVEDVQISRPGKHGGAKARLTAKGLFTDVKKVIVKPADSTIDVPVIEKKDAQVLAIVGDRLQIMYLDDYSTTEVLKSDEFDLKEGDEIVVWKFGDYAMIRGKK